MVPMDLLRVVVIRRRTLLSVVYESTNDDNARIRNKVEVWERAIVGMRSIRDPETQGFRRIRGSTLIHRRLHCVVTERHTERSCSLQSFEIE